MRVGFIGLGIMGGSIARCLIEGGHEVTVNDLKKSAGDDLIKLGAKWGASPKLLAQNSEAVITSLPGPVQMQEVVLNKETGVLAGLNPGSVYIDMTTNAPSVFRKVAAECIAKGVDVLDAPVSRRPPEMTIMVGGRRDTFKKYEGMLNCMAKNLVYVGDSGHGMIAKLMTQYMGYTYQVAVAEAFIIAAKAGVDIKILSQLIPISAGRGNVENLQRQIFERTFEKDEAYPSRSYNVIAKDLTEACEFAQQIGAPAFTGLMAKEVYARAEAQGWANPLSMVRILEQMAGFTMKVSPSNVSG
ncbi:MAG: NAD(P)-dependent oxidoreductase [Dehalococcoidia bacterium]|nr:NAD(P)-dependent oxidoreductase [Dehalococcoidia bacterium]